MKSAGFAGFLRVVACIIGVLRSATVFAGDAACNGPSECCVAERASELPSPQLVQLGVVLMGLSNVNERSGTWDADYYLYEKWHPYAGFTPQTEIINEVDRNAEQFDSAWVDGDWCVRTRRIRSTLHSPYNLRVFPFDHQTLTLRFSDSNYNAASLRYLDFPYAAGLEDETLAQLSTWRIEGPMRYRHALQVWRWDAGQPSYDYATFSLPVSRHVTFHLARFFLPLLIILMVGFSVFWIDPEDLNSQIGIGVTCLLAAIAFQYSQASSLPEVAYLTLADRIYACCYPAIALAMIESIYTNTLLRRGDKELALRIDHRSRWVFPLGLALSVAASVWISYRG